MNKGMRNTIDAFEMWCLRRMQRISYTAHKTNKAVLRQSCRRRKLFKMVLEKQLSFFGHIVRKGMYEFLAMTGKICGKRSRGRQRLTMMTQLKEFTGSREIIETARDRERWSELIHEASEAWDRQGT